MRLLITIFVFTFSVHASSSELQSPWIKNGCKLFRGIEAPRIFPGNECIFLSDGSFISATPKEIRKFSPDKTVLWSVSGHFHHQINLSVDQQRIFAQTSEIEMVNGKTVRNDVLLILDLQGKTIARTSLLKIVRESGGFPLYWPVDEMKSGIKADYETTHFNSVYEIPPNKLEKSIPWLKQGNIIVNGLTHGFFIFDPKLEKLVHHDRLMTSNNHSVHDVQVTPEGMILFFNNEVRTITEKTLFSAAQKIHPATKKLVWSFTSDPKEVFFSPFCGSVQEKDDFYFISHVMSGGFLLSKKDHRVIAAIPTVPGNHTNILPTFQMKLVEVDEFLRNSK